MGKDHVHFLKDEEKEDEQKGRDRLAVLDLLIERGADVTGPQTYCNTTLLQAITPGQEIIRVALFSRLLEEGVDVAEQTNDGRSALYNATSYRLPDVVRLLIEHGADVNQKNKRLIYAVDSHSPYVGGDTALHQAARNGWVEIARLLIEVGADVKAVDEVGITALHEAATHGYESRVIINLFLGHGVDINAQYGEKMAPVLHHTAKLGNITMVQYLLEKGARIAAADVNGMTALA
jgi:ankyrin repeat protein